MQISDLDGYLTAIVVGPELIMPSEWLPVIWGSDGPKFRNGREAEQIINIVMARYNEIIRQMNNDAEQFEPIFWETKDGDVIAMDWAEGFFDAVKLRPKQWSKLLKTTTGKSMMAPLIVLWTDEAKKQYSIRPSDVSCNIKEAADRIVGAVAKVYGFWKSKE
jgi:uncharacterized protein